MPLLQCAVVGLEAATTVCLQSSNAWLPSGCCIVSADTSWQCTQNGVLLTFDDCKGGAPDDTNLSGCLKYDFQADHAQSAVINGHGFMNWTTDATKAGLCPAHGGYSVTWTASSSN